MQVSHKDLDIEVHEGHRKLLLVPGLDALQQQVRHLHAHHCPETLHVFDVEIMELQILDLLVHILDENYVISLHGQI